MLKNLLAIFVLFQLCCVILLSQTENLPDKLPDDLNQEQWEYVRDLYAVDAIKLLARMDTLGLEIDSLKALKQARDNFDCEKELYAVVGANHEQVADFRIKFESVERKIMGSQSAPDDVSMREMSEITSSKIRCLPEFSDRYRSLNRYIASIGPNTNITESKDSYSIVKGDCLWRISKTSYGTPYLWPAIWEANKTDILDPNLIYPGLVLKIPVVNEDERNKAIERSKMYRRSRKGKNIL